MIPRTSRTASAPTPVRFGGRSTSVIAALGLALLGSACSDYDVKEIPDADGVQPTIEVDPTHIAFGGLEQGEVGTETFTIRSVGDVALDIGEIRLSGGSAFAVLDAPEFSVLAPGESAEVTVTYSPTTLGDAADVFITNSDPSLPQAAVALEGNGLYAQLVFEPNPLDFGYVASGSVETDTIEVVNAGGATLDVSSLLVLGEGFTAGEASTPFSLAPGESFPLDITFSPIAELMYGGEVWAESNTPGTTTRATVTGTSLQQPMAVCEASPSEIYALYDRAVWVGSNSYDPSGQDIVNWEWSLTSRPAGSAATMPSGTADRSGFVADVVGEYVAQLVVRNEDGVESAPCYATLNAIPSQSLWVEMYWDTEQDDMDLHMLNNGGSLRGDGDCYYANCVGRGLDWGDAGVTDDNPSLDIDDIPGTGPENINVQEPEEDAIYRVYVHDYQGSTPDYYGDNTVTVNIYIAGVLEWTGSRVIAGDDDYVPFAVIDWASRSVSSL